MPLSVTRLPNESWRDCVKRYSSKHGLEEECLNMFDEDIGRGVPEDEAAFDALYEWDCVDWNE